MNTHSATYHYHKIFIPHFHFIHSRCKDGGGLYNFTTNHGQELVHAVRECIKNLSIIHQEEESKTKQLNVNRLNMHQMTASVPSSIHRLVPPSDKVMVHSMSSEESPHRPVPKSVLQLAAPVRTESDPCLDSRSRAICGKEVTNYDHPYKNVGQPDGKY